MFGVETLKNALEAREDTFLVGTTKITRESALGHINVEQRNLHPRDQRVRAVFVPDALNKRLDALCGLLDERSNLAVGCTGDILGDELVQERFALCVRKVGVRGGELSHDTDFAEFSSERPVDRSSRVLPVARDTVRLGLHSPASVVCVTIGEYSLIMMPESRPLTQVGKLQSD